MGGMDAYTGYGTERIASRGYHGAAVPKRQHNLIAPKGALRPYPQYLLRAPDGSDVWIYRGREIIVGPDNRGGWWAEFNVVDPMTLQRMSASGVQYDIAGLGPAPDEQAALRYAVFTIDGHERLAEPGGPERVLGIGVVVDAVREIAYARQPDWSKKLEPPTRAEVARKIEQYRRNRPPEISRHELEAFGAMPLQDRIELIDEVVEIAAAWGGRYPNPDPATKAMLLSW